MRFNPFRHNLQPQPQSLVETTPLEDKCDWIDSLRFTPKQNLEQLDKHNLDSLGIQKFIFCWFNTSGPGAKLGLAYSFGIVDLNENSRFTVKNSFSRNYETDDLKLMKYVYWRDGNQCAYCGIGIRKGQGNIDHVIPRSSWPQEWLWLADDASNLVPAHKKCNLEKSNYYRKFQGENSLKHIIFQCPKPIKNRYECCKSIRNNTNEAMCEACPVITVLCHKHEESSWPICELPILKEWFGHN